MEKMNNPSDIALLKQYAICQSQPAFRELVRRHIDMVYAACLRQMREPSLAEDVTQAVFIILANKSQALGPDVELCGWLIKTARYAAMTAMRSANRRRKHEQEAAAMNPKTTLPANDVELWEQIAPVLDSALFKLSDGDRSTIVLRYLQDKPFDEVATILAISPAAARKRTSRALLRLRQLLQKAGISAVPDSLLAVLPLSSAVRAPIGLSHAITTASAAPGPTSLATARNAIKSMKAVSGPTLAMIMTLLALISVTAVIAIHRSKAGTPLPAVATLIANPPALHEDDTAQLVDLDDRPVSNAVVNVAGHSNLGQRSDALGFFKLSGAAQVAEQFIAYSQRSRRLAIFSRNADGSLPTQITLQYTEAAVDGIVLDSDAHPVVNTNVHLFLIEPDGTVYPLDPARTDKTGYYSSGEIPSGKELKIVASLSDSPKGTDSTGPVAMNAPYQIEMPDLISKTHRGKAGALPSKRVKYSGRVIQTHTDGGAKGIAGAELQLRYLKNNMLYDAGDVVTDASGYFSRLLPPAAVNVTVRLMPHPDFVDAGTRPSTDELISGKAVFCMNPALSLSGIVHDGTGQPIENALVLTAGPYDLTGGYQEPVEDCTAPRTDKQGRFIAKGLCPGQRDVSISSDEFVPVRLSVNVATDTKPLDVTLDAGISYSARLVDAAGKPIAGGRVHCEEWTVEGTAKNQSRSSSPLVRFTKTTTDGSFTLTNLPTHGSLRLYASPPNDKLAGMNFNWSAESGANPKTITLYPFPVIKGTVIDADTGETIPKFKVTPGWDAGYGFSALTFEYSKTINPGDGTFSKRIDGFAPAMDRDEKFQVQIAADGYTPALSPPLKLGETHQPFIIKLKKMEAK